MTVLGEVQGDGPLEVSATGIATGIGTGGVASQRIVEDLRSAILSGDLPPGTRIRQEEVATRLGASRIPVREALRILQHQGLIVLRANSGAWVARMSPQECEASYRIRERLEPLALAQSIPHLTDAQVTALEHIQDDIERSDDLDQFVMLDRQLHLQSYAGNPIAELAEMVDRLWNRTQPYRRAFVRLTFPGTRSIVNAEHRLLLDAIRRADTEAAEPILAGHIRRTRVALGQHPELFDDHSGQPKGLSNDVLG